MDIPTIAIPRELFYSLPVVYSGDHNTPLSRYRSGTGQWIVLGTATASSAPTLKALSEALSKMNYSATLVKLSDWEEGDDVGLRLEKGERDICVQPPTEADLLEIKESSMRQVETVTDYDERCSAKIKDAEPLAQSSKRGKNRSGSTPKADKNKVRRRKQLARASKKRNRK